MPHMREDSAMGKLFVILLIAGAIWVGMEIHREGKDQAFGGIFAPLESVRDDDGSAASALTPAAQEADAPNETGTRTPRATRSVPITQHVREKVTRDIQSGAGRRGN